ncbi:MAG: LamG domain-containing protein [Candidatus Aenigmarchaeota archaeon]|nr:LamG domain-containing protein [Candidatus Aenigmarchaeota archaeon]
MKHTPILLLILTFTLFSTLSYAQEYTVNSNTVALWHFNEGSGSLAKDETGRFNGTVDGATWTTGKYGNALSFDGVNDAVVVSSSSTEGITNQITLEAWVYPTKYGRIIGRYGSGSLSYLLTFEGAGLALYINSPSSGNAARSDGTVPLNAWTHIAATYDGSTVKFYINDVLDSTKSLNLGNIKAVTAPLIIGNDGYSDVAFGGIIDEVRITTAMPSPTTTTTTIPVNQTTTTTIPTNQTNQTTTTITVTTATTTTISLNQTNQTTTTTIPQTIPTTIASSSTTVPPSTTTTTVPATQNLSCALDSECAGKITCPQIIGNDTERCITNICQCGAKLVDKTVLLGILIQMETLKTSFVSLNNSAAGLFNYYDSINDTNNAGKWSAVMMHFGYGLANITQTENYINSVKDAPTQLDIIEIKNRIGNILLVVDAIVRVILGG